MRTTRALLLLSLALCGISAQAQVYQGMPQDQMPQQPWAPEQLQQMPQQQGGGYLQGLADKLPSFNLPNYGNKIQEKIPEGVQQGFQTIGTAKQQAVQGLMQTGQGLAQAGQGFVQAGHSALQNAATEYTNDVRSAVGAVANGVQGVTNRVVDHVQDNIADARTTAQIINGGVKTVGGAVFDSLRALPGDIKTEIADTRQGVRENIETAQQTAAAVGQFMQGALPALPPVTQMFSGDAWKESYKAYGSQLDATYDSLTGAIAAVGEGIEAKFCTPAEFTPSVKKPAKFTGPSFSLSFLSGGCSFDDKAFIVNKTKQLECFKPTILYSKAPANFTSKYKAAPKFAGKECVVTKDYGESLTKVLFVFDGSEYPDIKNLTSRINEEMKTVLGGVTAGPRAIAEQLHTFMSSLPMPKMPHMNLPNFGLPGLGGKDNNQAVGAFDGPQQYPQYEQLQAAAGTYQAAPVQGAAAQGPSNQGPSSLKDLRAIADTYPYAAV